MVRLFPTDTFEDDESRQVAAQLLNEGVAIEQVPRVRPEGRQNGWRYVWPSREEAESAAEQLARRTGGRWEARETNAEPSLGPLTWLQINATRESDSWVFALEPVTRTMIEQRFPGSCRHRRISIAVETNDDLLTDTAHFQALARQVMFLLTWLSPDELAVFGRFRVFDPQSRRVLLPETNIAGA